MRIAQLYASQFLGIANVDLELTAPIHLFAGRNGAGKSSLRDAIALALTADLGRVSLKKEAPQLIHDGADGAHCELTTSDGDKYAVSITAGGKITDSQKGRENDPALAYVLDAQRFARLDETARRAFLFGLMGVKTGQAEIAKRLKDKDADDKKVERILPLLRAGFESASKQAKTNATEAKGAWRTVTGETYGSEKAKTWKAAVPPYDAGAAKKVQTDLQHCDVAIESWQQQVGKLQAEKTRRDGLRAKLPALQEHALRVDRINTKLEADLAELTKWVAEVEQLANKATGAPRVGVVHELAKAMDAILPAWPSTEQVGWGWELGRKALNAYEAEYGPVPRDGAKPDPEAAAQLQKAQQSRELLERAVANDKRDLEAAKLAQSTADSIEAELAEAFDTAGLEAAQAEAEKLKAERAELVKKADTFRSVKAQIDAADKKTEEAAKHAADVAAWDLIGDALSPDGIPAEILAEALGPINERLAQSALDAEWPRVEIRPDMSIVASLHERPYGLLSESEKWRADAMLAEAIAHLSGTRFMVLDRFDVLDAPGRTELLTWLHTLADLGEVDTVFLFGTLKSEPTGLPSTIATHWIENGVVAQLKEAA